MPPPSESRSPPPLIHFCFITFWCLRLGQNSRCLPASLAGGAPGCSANCRVASGPRARSLPAEALASAHSWICLPPSRLPVLRDAGDGVGPDLRRPDQRLVQRRSGVGGRKCPPADGEDGLDRPAGEAALQERVDSGGFPVGSWWVPGGRRSSRRSR